MKPLAVTMGEPAGIGGELTLKAWRTLAGGAGPRLVALDDPARLEAISRALSLDVPIRVVSSPAEAALCHEALPVLPVPLAVPAVPGRPDPANARAVVASIEQAVALARAGEVAGVVTNPIQKATLYQAGFRYPGHTEFLGDLAGTGRAPVMMLACPSLRVVPVTIHVALRDIWNHLTTEAIVATGETAIAALRADFGIARPRIAVAGLNPHAGEGGAMGDEESRIVAPAIGALRATGAIVTGPHPPDTLFTPRARAGYDLALCLYHDQAMIPLKTLDVDGGVNVTLGLSIVRTSPDHGTALDIAGKGLAEPGSLVAAMTMAAEMVRARAALRAEKEH